MGQQVKETDDKFPAGISVLAVDDDQTCLMWLEHLLKECQYKVTTTLYAREAIEMLRQNKGKYDIVITDVQMPDIDGFQLLETIGLEMDLPVIMMSMYSDQDYVERGVLHGAVDYLLKPVRHEEIRNIWQHVLRKRKGKKVANQGTTGSQGAANGAVADSNVSAGETSNRKRRSPSEKDDEDYEDEDDSGRENDDQTSHKRPRVVWTPDLHRKFVSAVNQLGMDKAVPKKILDMMDVEGLTRENVASHLQKYRMYLKRISNGGQPHMLGGLGGRNSLDAMNYRGGRLSNSLLSGYPPSLSSILGGRQNPSIPGVNFRSISSTDLIQSGQNLRNAINPHARLLQPNGSLFPNGNLFQGMQGGFEQDPSQAGKTMAHIGGFNPGLGASGFGVSENFVDLKGLMNGSNSNNGLMFSGPSQTSQTSPSPGFGAFKIGGMNGSVNAGFLDHSGTPDSWKTVSQYPQSSFQMNGTFPQDQLPVNNTALTGNGIPSTGIQHQLVGFPQASSSATNNAVNVSQRWDHNKPNDFNQEMNTVFGSLNPIMKTNGSGIMGSSLSMDQSHLAANAGDFMGQVHGTPQTGVLGADTNFKPNTDSFIVSDQTNLPQDDFIPNNIESMDDIVNSMIGRENTGGHSSMFDGEFNFDDYNPGSGL
ncbi:unnamed protein product [Rhodiola kirilowii]